MAWDAGKITRRARGRIAGVRGAITVSANRAPAIRRATARLLRELMTRNRLQPSRIVCALFTSTPDLDADFPAHAARRMGWKDVPMLGALEVGVKGGLPQVIRVLLLVDGVRGGERLIPAYLEGAAKLRPDWAKKPAKSRMRQRTLAIVGLGQIGGSIGLALDGNPAWQRVGFDLNRRALAAARNVGAIDKASRSLTDALAAADLAVLAVPVDRLPKLIDQAAKALPRGAVLLDTGSTRGVLTVALRRASRRIKAVGGHPIAGNEGRGFSSARPDLFRGAPFVLWPARGRVPAIVRDLVRDLGARPLLVAPERHDRALARTSHLSYVVARALAHVGARHAAEGLSGPSFRDITRVAASDPTMAMAYVGANQREVKKAWKEVRREIELLIKA